MCRQVGKSLTIAIFSILEALRTPGSKIIIVGPTDRQAGELFTKITNIAQNSFAKDEIQEVTMRQMIFLNGSRINSYPVGDDGKNIRGFTADILILEEAAWLKDDIVSQVLLPFIASTNGKLIKISTPFSLNHFYKSFQADPKFKSHHVTWEEAVECGQLTKEFIEEQKNNMTRSEFDTEYCAAFIPDEDAYFPYILIDKCIGEYEMLSEV